VRAVEACGVLPRHLDVALVPTQGIRITRVPLTETGLERRAMMNLLPRVSILLASSLSSTGDVSHNRAMRAATLYTIGHGNRSLDEFISLLTEPAIRTLIDVRAHPRSSRFPHFDTAALREAMERVGIVYHWAGRQLGGRRPARPDSRHYALDEGLRGYADYMDTDEFQKNATQLVNLAARSPSAILCAERVPERCHRRLIADCLTLQGVEVIHLVDRNDTRIHSLSPEARRESAELIYDRNVTAKLDL
jgi:hypothetical protein